MTLEGDNAGRGTSTPSNRLQGIVTVLNTPFTENGLLDLPGLRRNVAQAIDAGIDGFLTPALASEVQYLSENEKRQLVADVVDESRDRVAVIGGASAPTQEERLKLTRDFVQLGCDGILIQLDKGADLEVMARDLAEIAELQPGFLMLQDWDPVGQGIPLATITQLFERIEPFQWLKIEVHDAGPKYSEVLAAMGGELRVAGGWAVTRMIDGLDRGVHVFMPTAMHRIYVEIYRRYALGNRDGAQQLFRQIEPILAFSNQRLDISIRFFKRLLHAQGVYATPKVRLGGPTFDAQQERLADQLIAKSMQIELELL